MSKGKSPKLAFLQGPQGSGLQLSEDGYLKIKREAYNPVPTAIRMHMSLARTRIVRGGLGSSKTRSACEHINNLCLKYPGSLHYIGRKDITSLKVTTQREYLEKVVSPETVLDFNINDNILYYKNGSQVLFREAKEPDKVKSLELTSFMLDECDENDDPEIYEKLLQRLRQKIRGPDGKYKTPPYCGLLVFNPVDDQHWLFELAHKGFNKLANTELDPTPYKGDPDIEDFRFDTKDNIRNLPPTYVEDLKSQLPSWDWPRLIEGHWGKCIKGRPVYHGFTEADNVRPIKLISHLPLLVGWDFGYTHPAISFAQIDPQFGRYFKLREFQGTNLQLPDVVEAYRKIRNEIAPGTHHVMHFGDPHGADKKDVGESSIDYLRIHHGIVVNTTRSYIKTGRDEIQHKIITKAPLDSRYPGDEYSLFLVDPSCRITIKSYEGGYHRDKEGKPVKDGVYDHLPDTDRYIIVNNMNTVLAKIRRKSRRRPRNRYTGY